MQSTNWSWLKLGRLSMELWNCQDIFFRSWSVTFVYIIHVLPISTNLKSLNNKQTKVLDKFYFLIIPDYNNAAYCTGYTFFKRLKIQLEFVRVEREVKLSKKSSRSRLKEKKYPDNFRAALIVIPTSVNFSLLIASVNVYSFIDFGRWLKRQTSNRKNFSSNL